MTADFKDNAPGVAELTPTCSAPRLGPDGATRPADRLRVLAVDADPAALAQAREALAPLDGEFLTAADGERALALCRSRRPDLLLLDLGLRGPNSLEICERIKASPALRDIRVLALAEEPSDTAVALAFAAGADDYLRKPIAAWELLARVRAHLRSKALHDGMLGVARQAEEEASAQETLLQLLLQDLQGPRAQLLGALDDLLAAAEPSTGLARRLLAGVANRCPELERLVANLLDLGKARAGRLTLRREPFSLEAEGRAVCREAEDTTLRRDLRIRFYPAPRAADLQADRDLVHRALASLLALAIKHSYVGGPIDVYGLCRAGGDEVGIAVTDYGPGIAPADRERLVPSAATVDSPPAGRMSATGLHLDFCRLAVEAQGGRIEVESEPDLGTCVTVWFPAQPRERVQVRPADASDVRKEARG